MASPWHSQGRFSPTLTPTRTEADRGAELTLVLLSREVAEELKREVLHLVP